MSTGRPYIDVAGQRFGRLVVTGHATSTRTQRLWSARCDCGGEVFITATKLRSGNTRSCGCLRRLVTSAGRRRHGHSRGAGGAYSPYSSWRHMRDRCLNPRNKDWRHYGGRGVTICARWQESYAAFLADMGPRPVGTSIDRIDGNGNYEPGNCRWATTAVQSQNRRRRHSV